MGRTPSPAATGSCQPRLLHARVLPQNTYISRQTQGAPSTRPADHRRRQTSRLVGFSGFGIEFVEREADAHDVRRLALGPVPVGRDDEGAIGEDETSETDSDTFSKRYNAVDSKHADGREPSRQKPYTYALLGRVEIRKIRRWRGHDFGLARRVRSAIRLRVHTP